MYTITVFNKTGYSVDSYPVVNAGETPSMFAKTLQEHHNDVEKNGYKIEIVFEGELSK